MPGNNEEAKLGKPQQPTDYKLVAKPVNKSTFDTDWIWKTQVSLAISEYMDHSQANVSQTPNKAQVTRPELTLRSKQPQLLKLYANDTSDKKSCTFVLRL